MKNYKHPRHPCKGCGKRYKLLTDKGLCAGCDYPSWIKKYKSVPNK